MYVREIVRGAIDCGATALIFVHNHSSGDPRPSAQDIWPIQDMVDAGRHLRLAVHDHVIVASTGHWSMRAMGLL